MMPSLRHILPLSCLLACTTLPAVSEGLYVEANAGLVQVDGVYSGQDLDFPAIGLRGGYEIDGTWAIEGDLQIGVQGDSLSGSDPDSVANTDFPGSAAVFARTSASLWDNASMHVRLGYAFGELDTERVDNGPPSGTLNIDGLAYGLGTILDFNNDLYLRADYTQYGGNGTTTDAFTLGIGVRF